jgi:hypothetical protein
MGKVVRPWVPEVGKAKWPMNWTWV